MLGKTHVIGAAAAGAGTAAAMGLSAGHAAAMAGGAAVTAKLPDIDRMINSGPNHRSLTHSMILAGGGVLALAYYFCSLLPATLMGMGFIVPVVVWGLAIGYVSHLVLDSCTSKKVPLFLPGGMKFGIGLVKTGTATERVFMVVMVASTLLFLFFVCGGATFDTAMNVPMALGIEFIS